MIFLAHTDHPGDQTGILYQSEQLRAWINEKNRGHIRVIRRLNFSSLIMVIRMIVEGQEKKDRRQVQIYIPASLKTIDSDILRGYIDHQKLVRRTGNTPHPGSHI